tara:strand:- start:99 stop:872 length:774 start_codon:yes stop_codon:yes gene_type:complete
MSVASGIGTNLSALRDQNDKLPTYRTRATTQADQYEVPAKAMDDYALDSLNTMNTAKQNLIDIGGKLDRDVACYAMNEAETIAYFNEHYGNLAVGVATTQGIHTGINGIGAADWVGVATVFLDTLTVYQYPKVEAGTLDTSTDDPRSGANTITLNSGNAGIGLTTIHNVSAGIGSTVFALTTGCHPASIGVNTTNYLTASTGISTFIDAANLVKTEKNELRFIAWSLGRKIATNSDKITDLDSVVDALEDPGMGGPY